MTGILNAIKKAIEHKPEEPKPEEPKPEEPKPEELKNKKCPSCENNLLVEWVIRIHQGKQLTDNPAKYPIGLRWKNAVTR